MMSASANIPVFLLEAFDEPFTDLDIKFFHVLDRPTYKIIYGWSATQNKERAGIVHEVVDSSHLLEVTHNAIPIGYISGEYASELVKRDLDRLRNQTGAVSLETARILRRLASQQE